MGLTVIKGGKDASKGSDYTYVYGCVTDTRLMGVLGLHLHWKYFQPEDGEIQHEHQYIYYDVEELGIDSIKIYGFDDEEAALLAEKASFGGLGAKMVPVTEREARYLVCRFAEETKRKKQPLPPETEELSFITDHPVKLSEEEKESLDRKICTEIHTDNEAINYYLMRVFGKDSEGAALLRKKGVPDECFEDVSLPSHATFLQNSIDRFEGEAGEVTYLAETLTESCNEYRISVSELSVEDKKICSVKKRSQMSISTAEASLLLNTDEYVSVFEIESDMDLFDISFGAYSVGMTKTSHETGDMFMEFRQDNRHVEKSRFRLSDDVFAIYYSTDYGQLILGTYSPVSAGLAEAKLMSFFKPDLRCTGRYHFAQSVIYEFALSGYDDFEAFISEFE
jgi:hypothetical protein